MKNNHSNASSVKQIAFYSLLILASFLYGAILSNYPNEQFKDFVNYLVYAEQSVMILTKYWYQGGIVTVLGNEPLWLLINIAISSFFSAENTVRLIIFFSASAAFFLTLKHNIKLNIFLVFFILLSPQIIKNYLIHIRQGFAVAIFLYGWFAFESMLKKIIFSAIAASVHSSFFFIFSILLISEFLLVNFDISLRIAVIAFFCLLIVILSPSAAQLIDARQAGEYLFAGGEYSGAGFLFWLFFLILMFLEGSNFLRTHIFQASNIIFYLISYYQLDFSARIIESVMIPLMLSGLAATGYRRIIFILLSVFYILIQWYGRWNQFSFGWGI